MKKRFSTIVLLASGILGVSLTSCRSTDTENNLVSGGPTAVTFNLAGTAFSDERSATQASVNGKGIGSVGAAVQKHVVMVNPSTMMVAELSSASDGRVSAQASVGGAIAAVSGNSLASGIQFRVIAYSQTDGSFQAYQDYTVGQQAVPMMLNVGASYTMVVYSYGTTALPAISTGEQTNINSAQVNYDDTNRDFMYFNQSSYIPIKGANVLNIILRHKVTQITTMINSIGPAITAVKNAMITPHYKDGIFPLSTGVIQGRSTLTAGVPLQFSGLPGASATANPVFVNADTKGNATASFTADITTNGVTITKSLPSAFAITPGNKSNLTINIQSCGAQIGGGVWKTFMCHNLGADTSADAFTPSAAVHGAKYQWGASTGETGRYISQTDDQSNSGAIPGWQDSTWKPDSSWSDTVKGPDDPCPAGYKVPTNTQWQAVINNNGVERVGTWANDGNYITALYFKNLSNQRTLMLPAAGARFSGPPSNGALYNRGLFGSYWSSSSSGANANFLNFGTYDPYIFLFAHTVGIPVRCIAE